MTNGNTNLDKEPPKKIWLLDKTKQSYSIDCNNNIIGMNIVGTPTFCRGRGVEPPTRFSKREA